MMQNMSVVVNNGNYRHSTVTRAQKEIVMETEEDVVAALDDDIPQTDDIAQIDDIPQTDDAVAVRIGMREKEGRAGKESRTIMKETVRNATEEDVVAAPLFHPLDAEVGAAAETEGILLVETFLDQDTQDPMIWAPMGTSPSQR